MVLIVESVLRTALCTDARSADGVSNSPTPPPPPPPPFSRACLPNGSNLDSDSLTQFQNSVVPYELMSKLACAAANLFNV